MENQIKLIVGQGDKSWTKTPISEYFCNKICLFYRLSYNFSEFHMINFSIKNLTFAFVNVSIRLCQGHNFNKFSGGVKGCPANIFVCDVFYLFFSNSCSPRVLSPVSCPAEVCCTTIFAVRNGKFSRVGDEPPPTP